jgi:hypothetical protein
MGRTQQGGIAMTDVGLRLLDSLYEHLMIDDRWAVRREGEFTWWANQLAQHVEVEPPEWVEGRFSCTVRIWTEVVADVDPSTDPLAVLAGINRSATLSALVWDQWEGAIIEGCSATVHDENFTWLSKVLSTAAVLQIASAQSRAHSLADLTGGVPASSTHPSAGQGPEMDDPLNAARKLIASDGGGPSSFIGAHFQNAGEFLDRMHFAGSADLNGLSCEVPFTRFTSALGGVSLVEMFTDAPHPEAGSGLLCVMTLPYSAEQRHIADSADTLNRLQSQGDTDTRLLGAWCPAPSSESTLAFCVFVPNALSQWVAVENLVSYMSTQSLFAASRLHALPGAVAWSAKSTSEQARAADTELTIARSDLATAFGFFVYRTDDGRILTDNEAFDELLPEIKEGLEGLPPEDQVIDGLDEDQVIDWVDVEGYIRESGIYELVEVKAWIVTQYTDGRTRWTNDQLREQVFPTSDHSDLSFEDWLAAQVDAGTLTAVEVLQYVGYEDEDADEETLITERLIID